MLPSLSTIILTHFPKLTYRRYQKILKHPTELERISDIEAVDLIKIGWEESVAREFILWRDNTDVDKLRTALEQEGISIITCDSPNFPRLLAEINDPPVALFVLGIVPTAYETIAIVGTRRYTNYGKQVTESFSKTLAHQNLALISGLALGIDSFVHKSALNAGGITVGVLGSGIDSLSIYPRAHYHLAEEIIAGGGAIVSEYPPGFEPTPYSFPARNRIIAGLSRATLVTEAPRDSGALITARAALDYNRDVLAIPHPITSIEGGGCNYLIQLGARLVEKPDDVLDALNLLQSIAPTKKITPTLTPGPEEKIYHLLTTTPQVIDHIIKQSQLPSATVTSTLLLLEMKGWVKQTGGMHYRLS
jgi:DNA processing protein